MKKIDIFFTCFTVLFAITGLYLDISIKSQSIYWMIAKLIGISIIVLGPLVTTIILKEHTRSYLFFCICGGMILLGFTGYNEVFKYEIAVCHDKFGREFNERRRQLGIPEIPANWQIDSKRDDLTSWHGKDSIGGHESKTIIFDKCRIDREDDEYYLTPRDGDSRHMEVIYQYAEGNVGDSTFFNYEVDNNISRISRSMADSIFAAEQIRRD